MASKTTKRRSPHEGGAYSYQTRAGERWAWKTTLTMPDGTRKQKMVRGFTTKKAALASLREALAASESTGFTEPAKTPVGEYLAGWLDSLRLAPSTVASYRKNVRLHIAPSIGSVPLASLTPVLLDRLYRDLERDGRADHRHGEGLSARTVRYIHTIISAALRDAVDAGLLTSNPASRAHPPTAKQARSPEMHPWSEDQVAAFLGWSREHSELSAAWHVLAYTGMRRGEALARCGPGRRDDHRPPQRRADPGGGRRRGRGGRPDQDEQAPRDRPGPRHGRGTAGPGSPSAAAWPWCWPAMTPWRSGT